jgi:hypothetical protein
VSVTPRRRGALGWATVGRDTDERASPIATIVPRARRPLSNYAVSLSLLLDSIGPKRASLFRLARIVSLTPRPRYGTLDV